MLFRSDEINILYDKNELPIGMIFIENTRMDTVRVSFDEKNEEYLIWRNNETRLDGYLFDQYIFEDNKIVAEYHKNRFYDSDIDSTLYIYNENKLMRNIRYNDKETITMTEYDNLSRPIIETRTIKFSNETIIWNEKFYYEENNLFPSKIETIHPSKEIQTKYIIIKKWES